MSKVKRKYDVTEIFYRLRGEKRNRLCTTEREASLFRSQLKKNRRKFLGERKVELVELT